MPPSPGDDPPEPYRWDPPALVTEPALHEPDEGGREEPRHASWLELFYDLAFVTVVGGLSGLFEDGFTTLTLTRFAALFVVVWWAWLGHTVYATRFATDDVIDRAFTLAIMLGAAGMAVQVPFVAAGEDGFVRGSEGFALAFAATRMPLLALYGRAYVSVPDARPLARSYLIGIGGGVALWVGSVLVPPPWRFALWGAGLLVDALVPALGRRDLERAPVDASHLPERVGLFTLIVLGESLIAITSGVTIVRWDPQAVVAGVLVFFIIAAIWWIYFTFLRVVPIGYSLGSAHGYLLAHLPLLLALAVMGDGLLETIIFASVEHTEPSGARVGGLALALWLAALLGLQGVSLRNVDARPPVLVTLAAVAAVAVVTALGPALHPLAFLGLLAGVLMGVAAHQMRWWRVAPESATE